MSMKLHPLSCPNCSHTFTPQLPDAPEIPEDLDLTDDPGVNAQLMTKIALVQAMLARLRDSLPRTFGMITDLTANTAELSWTLTVRVPRPQIPTDDVAIPMPSGPPA